MSSKKINPKIGFYESDELLREQFNFDDFYIHNLDSIFLFSSNNYKLVLINSKGSLEKIWDINQETANSQNDNFLHITTTGSSTFFYDAITKKMLFRSYPPNNFNLDNSFYSKAFGIKYNLQSEVLEESFGTWPKSYMNQDFLRPNNHILSYIPDFKKNIYYVSARYDHNIYKYRLDDNALLEVIDGKSNYFENFEKTPKKENTQSIIDYIRVNGYYSKLLHYPQSDKYYRIVLHNQPMRNKITQKLNNPTFNRNFSVIIFDSNMKKIGEHSFEDPIDFTFFSITSTPTGIMINSKDSNDENLNNFTFIDF
ncbi:hypothetical protein H7F37_13580 [Winogradskyella sp. PAMC22761]|nr:hypothetical protein H7F37_13580 [Winogradskyella sp. PAMC22761]